MTRNKLTIDDIQKALLSNTHFIKEVEPEKPLEIRQVKNPSGKGENSVINAFQIDPRVLKRIKILSAYLKIDQDEIINNALMYYLSIKSTQLNQAMQKLSEE
ncbi:MAG: hypothetical protein EHM93_08820 [Bacteroidales bacterium]|nr:MAG: hypothetical protein EHM93_08820 [Bacteroidales bacterium]